MFQCIPAERGALMKIAEVSKQYGLSADTLRYYEKFGLIYTKRKENGYRHYPPETLDTLKYIQIGQELGFSLNEIKANLQLIWDCEDNIEGIIALLLKKTEEIEARIQHLSALKASIHEHIAKKKTACFPPANSSGS